jgi:A/G-specific adenine glycosylase
VVEDHGGIVPRDFEALLALPGVGRYTAGAICSIAFNQPQPILDGNVIRVLTRVFGIGQNPRLARVNSKLWGIAGELVAEAARRKPPACSSLNQALMELGATICSPRQPHCDLCPLQRCCLARQQGRVHRLPNLGRRPAAVARRFVAFVVNRNGRWLVRQRPPGVVNALLWEFPNAEKMSKTGIGAAARRALGFAPGAIEPLGVIRHSITRSRITLEIFRIAKLPGNWRLREQGLWRSRSQLQRLPFAAAHRKILDQLPPIFPDPRGTGFQRG